MVRINENQYLGLMMALRLSVEMRSQANEIAALYRAGVSQWEIAKILFPENQHKGIVVSAIRKILYGHDKYGEIDAFEGAIPKEELEELEKRHRTQTGNRIYTEGRGIHAQTAYERSMSGKRGGIISGAKSLREKTGIHALTSEEKRENIMLSHISRGITPWSDEELSLAYNYSKTPEYRRNFSDLANRLNQERHDGENVRDASTLKSALRRYRTKNR